MILKDAKTVWVGDNPWTSPDKKVTIWTIKLEVDGNRDTYSTMSKALASPDFSGDVEVYTNDKGKTYARQAPKEEGEPTHTTPKKEWVPRDDDAIRAQWAIGQALVLYRNWNNERPEYDDIQKAARRLFAMVEEVKQPQLKLVTADTTVDEIIEMTDAPINLDDIPF